MGIRVSCREKGSLGESISQCLSGGEGGQTWFEAAKWQDAIDGCFLNRQEKEDWDWNHAVL